MEWLVFAVVVVCCCVVDAVEVNVTSNTITEGHELIVTCETSDENCTLVSFHHNWGQHEIRKLEGIKENSHTYVLKIPCAGYQDSGIYQCSVKMLGNSTIYSNTTSVLVKAKPKLIRESGDITGIVLDTGEQCVVRTIFSNPNVTSFSWSRPDNTSSYDTSIHEVRASFSVHGQTLTDVVYNFSLSINSFTPSDAGTYALSVCNEVGCSRSSVNVTAAGPPLAPTEVVKEAESTPDAVMLSWMPNYPGGNFVQRFLVEYRVTGDAEWKMYKWYDDPPTGQKVFASINNLLSMTTYDVRVSARTNRIANNSSDFVEIQLMTAERQSSAQVDGMGVATFLIIGFAVGFVVGFIVAAVAVMEFVRRHGYTGTQMFQKTNDATFGYRKFDNLCNDGHTCYRGRSFRDTSTRYEEQNMENGSSPISTDTEKSDLCNEDYLSITGKQNEQTDDFLDCVTPSDVEIHTHM